MADTAVLTQTSNKESQARPSCFSSFSRAGRARTSVIPLVASFRGRRSDFWRSSSPHELFLPDEVLFARRPWAWVWRRKSAAAGTLGRHC